MTRKITAVLMIICLSTSIFAQITTHQKPLSHRYTLKTKSPSLTLLPTKMSMTEKGKNNPLRFAWLIQSDISPEKDGEWTKVAEGKIWRLKIKSPGAFSLNFLLEPFHLPKEAKLFLYSADSSFVVGAITDKNNKKSLKLPIQAIPGDEIYIEYFLPKNINFKNDFRISQIGYDFKNAFGVQTAGACEVNINCPEGDNWQTDKRAVARMLINNQFYCTGSLINNARYDGKPYLLTAEHCVHYQADAEKTIFYFNYESAKCTGTTSDTIQTVSGSEVIATGKNEKLDFSLLQLSSDPPETYQPYYAGWNRSSTPPNNVSCIHHPDGDIKKISRDYDTTLVGDFGDGYDINSHWQILKWDLGTTEGGSSGSPLFNNKHQIVGDLTGGEANCTIPVNDYFSRIDRAWQDYSDPFYQLKNWLDPINSGVEEIGGFDPYSVKFNLDLACFSIANIKNISCSNSINPEVLLKNKGTDTIYSFQYKLIINKQTQLLSVRDTILPLEYYKLTVPKQELSFGNFQLQFILDKANNQVDEDNSNDTLLTDFQLKDWSKLTLSFTTDGYAQESSWYLKDLQDSTLYQSNIMAQNKQYNTDFCMDKDCYALTIVDAGGDGICCQYGNGNYILYDETRRDTIATGGNFTDSVTTNFCLNQDTQIVNNEIPFLLFPNPVREHLNVYLYENKEYQLTIYGMDGKLRLSKKYFGHNIQIDISALEEGIYYLKISESEKMSKTKFVIIK